MSESIGIIGRCDPLVAREIEEFLKKIKGFRLIYFTHSPDHKLYIVDSERIKELTENREPIGDD